MTLYANYDNITTVVLGFYDSEINLSVPTPNIVISAVDRDNALEQQGLGKTLKVSGGVIVYETNYDSLRAAKKTALKDYENSLRDTGATWPSPTGNDKPYRIRMDLGDIQNYTALAINAVSAATATDGAHSTFLSTYADPGMTLFSTDTSTVPTLDTKEKAINFATVMLTAHRDVAAVSYSKQAEIDALLDNEATIAAYNVTTGWPSI